MRKRLRMQRLRVPGLAGLALGLALAPSLTGARELHGVRWDAVDWERLCASVQPLEYRTEQGHVCPKVHPTASQWEQWHDMTGRNKPEPDWDCEQLAQHFDNYARGPGICEAGVQKVPDAARPIPGTVQRAVGRLACPLLRAVAGGKEVTRDGHLQEPVQRARRGAEQLRQRGRGGRGQLRRWPHRDPGYDHVPADGADPAARLVGVPAAPLPPGIGNARAGVRRGRNRGALQYLPGRPPEGTAG